MYNSVQIENTISPLMKAKSDVEHVYEDIVIAHLAFILRQFTTLKL